MLFSIIIIIVNMSLVFLHFCSFLIRKGVYTDLSKDMYKNWIEQIMEIEDLTELIDDYDEELEQNISSTDDLDAPNTEPTATTTTETTSTPWFDKPISNAIACADIMNMYFYLLLILISYFGIFIEI